MSSKLRELIVTALQIWRAHWGQLSKLRPKINFLESFRSLSGVGLEQVRSWSGVVGSQNAFKLFLSMISPNDLLQWAFKIWKAN